MNRLLSLALFLLVVVGGGLAVGFFTAPGEWYAGLAKPAFNPPNWLFGPVWTLLYILIAIAGWLVWRRRSGSAMTLWWTQLALNFLWSPVFFAAQSIGGAVAVISALLVTILVFIAAAWRKHRTAALLFLPYAAWVAFATVLNASILMLN